MGRAAKLVNGSRRRFGTGWEAEEGENYPFNLFEKYSEVYFYLEVTQAHLAREKKVDYSDKRAVLILAGGENAGSLPSKAAFEKEWSSSACEKLTSRESSS